MEDYSMFVPNVHFEQIPIKGSVNSFAQIGLQPLA